MPEYVSHPIRMPKDLLQRLEQEAQQRSVPLNEFIPYILNLHITQLDAEKQGPILSSSSVQELDDEYWTIPVPITLEQIVSESVKQQGNGDASDQGDDASDPTIPLVPEISVKEQINEIIEGEKRQARP